MCLLFFFFFKQKTAYEVRISDWSSDVCSSDLSRTRLLPKRLPAPVPSRPSRRPSPMQPRLRRSSPRSRPSPPVDPSSPRLPSWSPVVVAPAATDRQSVVSGKSVSVRVDLGGRGHNKQKNTRSNNSYRLQ